MLFHLFAAGRYLGVVESRHFSEALDEAGVPDGVPVALTVGSGSVRFWADALTGAFVAPGVIVVSQRPIEED